MAENRERTYSRLDRINIEIGRLSAEANGRFSEEATDIFNALSREKADIEKALGLIEPDTKKYWEIKEEDDRVGGI